jgi:hypothetical protein
MKAAAHQAVSIGWNAEAFRRTKTMKKLDEYLKPALSPEQKRAKGNRAVLDMMLRAKKRGATDGAR